MVIVEEAGLFGALSKYPYPGSLTEKIESYNIHTRNIVKMRRILNIRSCTIAKRPSPNGWITG